MPQLCGIGTRSKSGISKTKLPQDYEDIAHAKHSSTSIVLPVSSAHSNKDNKGSVVEEQDTSGVEPSHNTEEEEEIRPLAEFSLPPLTQTKLSGKDLDDIVQDISDNNVEARDPQSPQFVRFSERELTGVRLIVDGPGPRFEETFASPLRGERCYSAWRDADASKAENG